MMQASCIPCSPRYPSELPEMLVHAHLKVVSRLMSNQGLVLMKIAL